MVFAGGDRSMSSHARSTLELAIETINKRFDIQFAEMWNFKAAFVTPPPKHTHTHTLFFSLVTLETKVRRTEVKQLPRLRQTVEEISRKQKIVPASRSCIRFKVA